MWRWASAPVGKIAGTQIKKIGGSPEVRKHLSDLGFVVGGNVTVITSLNGSVIVNVKETRVAISEEMARKIMI
ncbi:MAG: ferrous iron transport protein A [Lachnospiraceae bacterium]|nr:ferrous iron transport protein A [Lachnospiraceae bacterium]